MCTLGSFYWSEHVSGSNQVHSLQTVNWLYTLYCKQFCSNVYHEYFFIYPNGPRGWPIIGNTLDMKPWIWDVLHMGTEVWCDNDTPP